MKVYKTRLDKRQADLKMRGLLPIDRRILLHVGRNMSLTHAANGAASYCFQVAAMTAVDAHIMSARTRCRATTPVGISVALQISDAQSEAEDRDHE